MPQITTLLTSHFARAIRDAWNLDADPLITPAQNPAFGDYQSNAAMGLVKRIAAETGEKQNPRAIAQKILDHLDLGPLAAEPPAIAGPGFINIKLSPTWIADQLTTLADRNLGIDPADTPQRVIVDYSGPNIAKQMHVGHLRSTIIGDAIARTLESLGHEVIRQNHLGDWGTQFGMLIACLRRQPGGLTDNHIDDLEDFYRTAKTLFDEDPSFQDEARAVVVKLQAGSTEEVQAWTLICDETRRHYQPVYDTLHVALKPEHERGESFYNPFLPETVAELQEKGVATESEGALVIFTEGYESPLIVRKSDGGYLYGTTDLSAIRHRTREMGAQRIIYVHDSRQFQHFMQVFDAARRAGFAGDASLEYAPFGTMLGDDGKPFKTRSGGTVKLKDLLDEAEERAFQLVTAKNPDLLEQQRREIARAVGIGAVKYSDLSKDRTGDYLFAWDKMLSMEGNTGPYLMYAYTRIRSIFRKAGAEALTPTNMLVESPHELALAKQILRFPEILAAVARDLKPHILCAYLYELAGVYNGFYENCPVLKSEGDTRTSRLVLCQLTADTLARGLALLGIPRLEQM